MTGSISDVFQERPGLRSQLKPFHPVESAALVSGLLTEPSLQANTLRLETLVHLLVAFAAGDRKLQTPQISSWLNTELGSTMVALWEDPIEDVFVSNVTTEEGNVRIFEGIWESSDFYLQRILNVIGTLQDSQSTCQLKQEVRAALRISEEIAARRRLDRFSSGNGLAKGTIRLPSLERLKALRRAIMFSPQDLHRLGISPADLAPFIFQLHHQDQLKNQALDDSELERRPIIQNADRWFVLLATAVSVAVRQHVLKWMCRWGLQNSFERHLILEYQDFLANTPILGSPIPKEMILPSKQISGKTFLEFGRQIDAGRYLQVIAIIDGIAGYLNHGFSSPDPSVLELSDQIDLRVKNARTYFHKQEGFKQGLTLLIGCGYGRPNIFRPVEETPDWKVEFVSAPDFQALAWLPGASPLLLWKMVDHERFLAEHGISISNANGLLNLYGWWSDTGYLMLDPMIEFGGDPINMVIPTDCLADIRSNVRRGWDVHALPLPDGRFVRVRRVAAHSYFPGESNKPQYACIDAILGGELLGVRVGERLIWWVAAEHGRSGLSRDLVFRIWEATNNWLDRAVPVFERQVEGLPGHAVLITLDFNDVRQEQVDPVPEHVLRSCLSVSTDRETKTIRISFRDPFFGGFRNPRNVAERTLIRAIAMGVVRLGGEIPTEDTIAALVSRIAPNEDIRYVHFFEVTHFRDIIQRLDRPRELFVDDADTARSKLGLGWLVQERKDGNRFGTAAESVPFLNRVVDALWNRMRTRLHKLDRTNLIERALRHIEGVADDKTLWERTIRAVLAFRDDKASAKLVAMRHVARCNAAEIALRLVVEMAVSECPLEGGEPVGELDLTPLMSDVLLMFHLGGCSDAIIKGVMEPEVRIASSGDVLTHVGFRDEIADPLGQRFESVRLDHDVERYEKHFGPFEPIPTVQGRFPEAFLTAFEAEFGLSIDALRGARETLENLAFEKEKCVFVARKDEIRSYFRRSDLTTAEVADIVLNRLALWPRESWDVTPEGFKKIDWYPWRFGRRLSLVARPIVRLENDDNPRYVISPGLIGAGIAYTMARYYEAAIEASECRARAMCRWINEEKNRRGHAFAHKVFETMRTLGYEARFENKVAALLNEKFDRDWGDVDVLAWKRGEDEVLAIECKDLKQAMTPNEMAEQLNRFSGQTLSSGKDDELLKHLNRCDLLRARSRHVAQTIGMEDRDIHIQTVVCFSKIVPMQYVARRFPNVTFLTIDDLREGGKLALTTKQDVDGKGQLCS
jgi:hypothetical protein